MKKLLLFALLVLSAIYAPAQSKLNPAARIMVNDMKMFPSRVGGTERVSALVRLAEGADVSVLSVDGVKLISSLGRYATVSFPLELAETVAAIPEVESVNFGQKAEPVMDIARQASWVSRLQQGTNFGFTKNYKGDGILLGMMDEGLDPNHINFYNDDMTENRIREVTVFKGSNGTMTSYDTPEKILAFTTDKNSSTHATHVAGIMGGAYNKRGNVAFKDPNTGYDMPGMTYLWGEYDVPFYGVAPEALLYPCVGDLYNANIIAAAQLFAKKCKELGKPGVFNLSVGYVAGPHDGTDDINKALAEVGKEVIVCVAAGNDGDTKVSIQGDFSSTRELKTVVTAGDDGNWDGGVDVWSDNSSTFAVSFALIDKSTRTVLTTVSVPTAGENGYIIMAKEPDQNYSNVKYSPVLGEHFTSESKIQFVTEVSPENNRYEVYIQFKLTPGSKCNAVPALIFSGSGTTKMNAYGSQGLAFSNEVNGYRMTGYTDGNANQSINNIACGENIIVVGAYVSKTKWPLLKKGYISQYTSPLSINGMAPFTSYGDVYGSDGPTGKTLPDVCAPGMGIVSSYSKYYAIQKNLTEDNLCAEVATTLNTSNGAERQNQWAVEQGTSMATPYVTGTVALLLEADPSLKVDKVRDLLTRSAVKQSVSGTQAIQWGAGRLNADDAMHLLLGQPAEIGNVAADSERRFAVSISGDVIEATVAGESNLTATLHSLAGAQVATGRATGDTVRLSTGSLPKGVYILTVVTPGGIKLTRSLLLQ